MQNQSKARREIVRATIARFFHLPAQTIARDLVENHPEMFNGNIETARTAVRRVLGTSGERNRREMNPELFRSGPIKMPQTWRKKTGPYKIAAGSWLVLADVHIPFHEPVAVETAMEWGKAEKVDGIFINGDLADFAGVGFWPTARRDFNAEVEILIDFLDLLRQEFPKAKIVYKPGNHEYRLPRYFISKAPELATSPLAAMESVMGFAERGIEFLDFYQMVKFGNLAVFHGHEFRNLHTTVSPARGLALKAKAAALCSHCHRTSETTPRDCHGAYQPTWSTGCLCDLSPDYNPFGNDWNWGAAIIHCDGSEYDVDNRRITPQGKLK